MGHYFLDSLYFLFSQSNSSGRSSRGATPPLPPARASKSAGQLSHPPAAPPISGTNKFSLFFFG